VAQLALRGVQTVTDDFGQVSGALVQTNKTNASSISAPHGWDPSLGVGGGPEIRTPHEFQRGGAAMLVPAS
jgi:hypothetical protein